MTWALLGSRARRLARLGVPLIVTAAAGCHSPVASTRPEQWLRDGGDYQLVTGLEVPRVSGVAGCGAQALATVLAFGTSDDPSQLAEELPWHDTGATPIDLLLEARRRGYDAAVRRGSWPQLLERIEADRPTLVMFDAGVEVLTLHARIPTVQVMHWAVVSGSALDDSLF
ncbi:MAG: hypothetical protein ACYTGC_09570 [Planctomycetota bacterium]|jgi:hypothetical protein